MEVITLKRMVSVDLDYFNTVILALAFVSIFVSAYNTSVIVDEIKSKRKGDL